MSDSDDTDILLLIPPDFFISSAEEKFFKERKQRQQQQQINYYCPQKRNFLNETISCALRNYDYDTDYNWESLRGSMESLYQTGDAADAIAMPPPTAAYQFLPPRRKTELNHINARLSTIEREQLTAPSELSTISNCTVRTQQGCNAHKASKRDTRTGLVHSTPKSPKTLINGKGGMASGDGGRGGGDDGIAVGMDEGVLNEIDNFLDKSMYLDHRYDQHYSDDYRRYGEQQPTESNAQEQHASSLPNSLNRLSLEQKFSNCGGRAQEPPSQQQDKLISLSEIWGNDGHRGGVAIAGATNVTLKEEQLRRHHLEKTVRTLQSRLLEYQQRLSVAIEVDRSKDAALASTQADCKSLHKELYQLRDRASKLETEHEQCSRKQDVVQHELAQAVDLASKFQSKNEKLEAELANVSRKTNECNSTYKKEIEDLELKLQSSKTSEELALNELNKFKDKLVKADYQNEKLKTRCTELEKESSTLRQQKELLQDYHQKQKNRADSLETQKKSLQDAVENLTQIETDLKRKLELQQKTLKSHYQQQLENVVAQKLKEFQEQLDKMEENLRTEARERERLIADRAVKQLELINEKNELELNLMQEKHNEEVELYRIQLANASKKIDDLEFKLNAYKSRRVDIAEKLHDVMETQWQKALEILTSPNQSRHNEATITDADTSDSAQKPSKSNGYSDTPKTSKNNNNDNNNDPFEEASSPPPLDRLQAYIELLLSKSPSDFKKLDEILALSTKSKSCNKQDKNTKRLNNGKPPWKS